MASTDTPMFRQYASLKAQVPDAVLMFRMGDFYEVFFDDAKLVAETCELTLTSRNKGHPDAIPMAGVPHHSARAHIQTLVQAGHKVAMADQVEDPALAKGLVKRAIVRIVTPGVGLDPEELAPREPCWLAGVCRGDAGFGFAVLDVSTGDLRVTELDSLEALLAELGRTEPREVVLPLALSEVPELRVALTGLRTNTVDEGVFEPQQGAAALARRFEVADLTGFGAGHLSVGLGAAWAVVDYASGNLQSTLPHLRELRPYAVGGFMVLDEATRRNLELTRPLRGTGRKGTLIGMLDRTATAMGGRLLREWVSYPLLDLARLRRRQDAVQAFVDDGPLRRRIRDGLKQVADLERIAGKVAQGSGHARDLVALRGSLEALPEVADALRPVAALAPHLPGDLCGDVAEDIATWLVDEPPLQTTEGGLIRRGADEALDELATLSRDGKAMIAAMESSERERTGIGSLKVRFNKVMGYYIEITRANLHRVPDDYIRKQTLTNSERYLTPELKEFEQKVLNADEKKKALEYALFVELRDRIALELARLKALGHAVAVLDVFASLAEVASGARYCRPVVDDSSELSIEAGRHPVVERQDLGEKFVPNDLALGGDGRRLLIVTGPNMSGKSTVMRQTALIALLAQIGSFVPARQARIGLCDRVFTRVGASDDLSSGRSTFMVEMSETANILHHATERSLVLLDEIGRGTSTYDGLAIAWAVAETLHDQVRCRALFATHYHELLDLAAERPHVANVHVAVSEWGERILFLRKLKEGGASRSYGIQCARLAGMPHDVVERAKTLLVRLEKHASQHPTPQLGLFGAPRAEQAAAPVPRTSALDELLAGIDPDALTPRAALDALYRLKEMASS